MSFRYPQAVRLLRRSDFERVYRQGRRRQSERFVVRARRNRLPRTRFGISVRARLGGAVVRNRIKRRVREILRKHRGEFGGNLAGNGAAGWDVVVEPRTSAVAVAEFTSLGSELTALVREALR